MGSSCSLVPSESATGASSPVLVETIVGQARAGMVSLADARVTDVSGRRSTVEDFSGGACVSVPCAVVSAVEVSSCGRFSHADEHARVVHFEKVVRVCETQLELVGISELEVDDRAYVLTS